MNIIKQYLSNRASRNYLRKWGSWIKNDEFQYPTISPKYDIGLIIKNCNQQILSLLEPWCSTMYVDCDYKEYINQEQINTSYDLSERIYPYDNEKQNHILIKFDGDKFNQSSFSLITMLPEIIQQTNDLGSFELDIFTIDIIDLTTFENTLIHL